MPRGFAAVVFLLSCITYVAALGYLVNATPTATTIMQRPSMEEMVFKMVATSALYQGHRGDEDYTGVVQPGTRERQLRDLETWASNEPPRERLRLITATAGTGKTAMLRSFCTNLQDRLPPISFFAWKGDNKRNTLKHFPATIAYQLSQKINALVPRIQWAPHLLQPAFKEQMEHLVIRPLLSHRDDVRTQRHVIIVVDGLDELDAKGQTEFLDFIPYFLSELSFLPISLLVSSRPEVTVVAAFKRPKLASITRITELRPSYQDVRKYLNDTFDDMNFQFPELEQEHGYKWPSQEKRDIIVAQSSGLFFWPAVVIDHIKDASEGGSHDDRLENVLAAVLVDPSTHYTRHQLSLKCWQHDVE